MVLHARRRRRLPAVPSRQGMCQVTGAGLGWAIEIDAKRWRSLDAVFAVVGRIDGDPDTGSWTVCAFVDEGEAADYADLCARQIVTAPDEPDHRNGYTHPVRHVVADPVGHSYRIWGVIRYRVERLAIGSVAKDVAL